MSRIGLLLLLFLPLLGTSQVPTAIRGVVFEDGNGNAAQDPGETGLSGVVVSNQIDVVTTGAAGEFTLPGSGTGVVFVCVPATHRAARGFWRKASGSPLEFALARGAVEENYAFVHASDTHVSEASLPRMEKLRSVVARAKPAFVLITGDLVKDALRVSEAEARGYYTLFDTAAKRLESTVWTVPGNHEIFGIERHRSLVSSEHPLYGRKMYRDFFGPDYYSFDYGRVHFVGVNSVDFEDISYYGHVDEDQLRWLERDLGRVDPGTTVVTFQHIPFFGAAAFLSGIDEDSVAPTLIRVRGKTLFRHTVSNAHDVLERLRAYRHTLALGGHYHARERIQFENERGATRFYQTAAVVGPAADRMTFPSGVVLYRVLGTSIDDGEFLPLDETRR